MIIRPAAGRTASAAATVPTITKTPSREPGAFPVTMV
jgi:hypothetical protein